MTPPRVFVVQRHRKQSVSGELVDAYDLSPAGKWGELVDLLSPTAAPWDSATVIAALRMALHDYRGNVDMVLLVGNPCLIGMACAVASSSGDGVVRMLQWDGKRRNYRLVVADLRHGEEWRETWRK